MEQLDTLQPRRCGCVPQLSLVYGGEEVREGEEGWEEPSSSPRGREGSWASRIPLLGPFWCVRGSATTTIRRRYDAIIVFFIPKNSLPRILVDSSSDRHP